MSPVRCDKLGCICDPKSYPQCPASPNRFIKLEPLPKEPKTVKEVSKLNEIIKPDFNACCVMKNPKRPSWGQYKIDFQPGRGPIAQKKSEDTPVLQKNPPPKPEDPSVQMLMLAAGAVVVFAGAASLILLRRPQEDGCLFYSRHSAKRLAEFKDLQIARRLTAMLKINDHLKDNWPDWFQLTTMEERFEVMNAIYAGENLTRFNFDAQYDYESSGRLHVKIRPVQDLNQTPDETPFREFTIDSDKISDVDSLRVVNVKDYYKEIRAKILEMDLSGSGADAWARVATLKILSMPAEELDKLSQEFSFGEGETGRIPEAWLRSIGVGKSSPPLDPLDSRPVQNEAVIDLTDATDIQFISLEPAQVVIPQLNRSRMSQNEGAIWWDQLIIHEKAAAGLVVEEIFKQIEDKSPFDKMDFAGKLEIARRIAKTHPVQLVTPIIFEMDADAVTKFLVEDGVFADEQKFAGKISVNVDPYKALGSVFTADPQINPARLIIEMLESDRLFAQLSSREREEWKKYIMRDLGRYPNVAQIYLTGMRASREPYYFLSAELTRFDPHNTGMPVKASAAQRRGPLTRLFKGLK